MPDQRLALTDKILIGMPFARSGQIVVRDTEQPGFAVRIGAATKTFIIQADLRREDGGRSTIKMKVCEVGELNTRDARTKARGLLLLIASGEDPRPKKKVEILAEARAAEQAADEAARVAPLGIPTLREAWSRFRVSHLERKKRSPATIRGYADHMERLFADWLDRPLSELGEASRAAVKQACAQSFLEPCDGLADRRRRNAQTLRRTDKAACLGGVHEDIESAETVHCGHPYPESVEPQPVFQVWRPLYLNGAVDLGRSLPRRPMSFPAHFTPGPTPTVFIVNVIHAHPGRQDEAFAIIQDVVHYVAERKPGFLWSNLAKSTDGLTVVNIEAIADEGNVGEFFADPVFVEKFKRLDAVSTSEFHTYRVTDLVLPGVVAG